MKIFFALILVSYFFTAGAQSRSNNKKYPSLLWEITGNGLKKPSHLIGTMHVSSKMAFNLPDSFYLAIRNAQVVALESNPETWQEDMSKYDFSENDYPTAYPGYPAYSKIPGDYFKLKTLKFYKYDTRIERALYSNPSSINNLLYRSYGNETSDFEEDTYLDMYIFQCGKKWNKKVTGVENYGESMRLMMEAYRDAAKDKNIPRRSYSDADNDYSQDKLQDAYRTGNLDMLDSINKYNSISAAFDEKFLYRRNEIQAASIDSILRTGSSLFVGVGAAHLPGERGVIEILRRKGYRLRPVKMGERASREKELVDRIRVPVVFHSEPAADGMYHVDIPGKFYQYGDDPSINQRQYADMSNGSYYMVTRIRTHAWMWNHKPADVYKTIDSLLYENIPGKIISKSNIQKNGYSGFNIINRTRRGDIQRYNIFITPFEVILFKMSGNGEYVSTGTEAARFFGSISLKEFKGNTDQVQRSWKKFSPTHGGFAVNLPHDPFITNEGSWIFDAEDARSGEHYRVMRTDIHNYHFIEEDSFDLSLMDESFGSSDFIAQQIQRVQHRYKGYPALDSRYKDKMGNLYLARFIIAGPHYYTLIAHGKTGSPAMSGFLDSFEFQPLVYGQSQWRKDSSLYFKVLTPFYPAEGKIKLALPNYVGVTGEEEDDPGSEPNQLEDGTFRSRVISNDSTGEKIFLSFYRAPRYYYATDSMTLEKEQEQSLFGEDSSWITRSSRSWVLPNKMKVWEQLLTAPNSSRVLLGKSFYKDGISFSIATQTDSLRAPSPFLKSFFETFTPTDTLKGMNPFQKKSALFFSDFMSTDSTSHKRAIKHISNVDLDSADLPQITLAIQSLNWQKKKYLDTKTSLINRLGDIATTASANYLKNLYYALDDTIELQYSVLENLLQHQTSYAYRVFSEIIRNEPPVLQSTTNYNDYLNPYLLASHNGKFLDELSDSLQLTKTILPELLPLLNLEDYKSSILDLLGQLVDSNLVSTQDYEQYADRFLLEAKQELKKQLIAEKKISIQKAENEKENNRPPYSFYDEDEKDTGNEDMNLYATILLPYWDKKPAVQTLVMQMLGSNDRRLKYNTLMLLVRNNKPYPDSLLHYFASLDDYRYELYNELAFLGKKDKFPARYNNHPDLGISMLLDKKTYGKPDTLMYLDRLKTTIKQKTGYLYFYKYKEKKDDLTWRLAVVGLLPEDATRFETGDGFERPPFSYYPGKQGPYSFTSFSEIKFNEKEPLVIQLQKMQKRLIYSKRKSGKLFYEDSLNQDFQD